MSEFVEEDNPIGFPDDLDSVPTKYARRNRKKVTAEWSDEATLMLIASVEAENFLWNAGNKDYRNRNLRNTVWQEISDHIFNKQYDATELQAKWSNLRIQFKFYHTKAKQSGQGEGENVSWKYYSHMMFVAAGQDDQVPDSKSNLVFDTEHESDSSSNATGSVNRKRKKTEPSDYLKMIVHEDKQHVSNQPHDEADSFQAFGNFVASELRKIPDAAMANRIQRTLTRHLMDLLDDAETDLVQSSQLSS